MDTVAEELKGICSRVVVPTSVPGLVTDRLLVMQYLDGVPLTQLGSKMSGYTEAQKRVGLKRVRFAHCVALRAHVGRDHASAAHALVSMPRGEEESCVYAHWRV